MALFQNVFAAVIVAGMMASGPVVAQTSSPAAKPAVTAPAKPVGKPAASKSGTSGDLASKARKEWDGISTMTRRQWNVARSRWAKEKSKWTACNSQARARKLSTADRWTAVGKCMMN
jgi:hypothetical protein